MNRMILKRTLALILTLTATLTFPLTSRAEFENTHINTGDSAEDIIAIAITQLGYMEGSLEGNVQKYDDCTKYGKWYGLNYNAWCAMFVSWCADQAGIPTTIIPKHASCDVGMQWFLNRELFEYSDAYGGSYTPKRGDIVYFGYQMTSGAFDSNHVGIVYKVENAKIYVYEGNSSAKVQSVSYPMSGNKYILGYGTPQYKGYIPPSYKTGNYLVNTAWLNFRSEPNTSSQKLELLARDTLLEITEISDGWGKSVYNGKTGWVSLEYCKQVYCISYISEDADNMPSTQYKTPKTDITLSKLVPERKGYEFSGWATEKNGASVYSPGDNYTQDKDLTLYAVWSKNSFVVSYDANGGKNAPKDQIKGLDKELILSSVKPTREGYGFFGWSLTPDGEAVYMPGDTYSDNKSITLYALWDKAVMLDSYTISFDANGGKNPPAAVKKTEGEDASIPEALPQREGFRLRGWAYDSNAKWPDYQPGERFLEDRSVTLYALWTKVLPNISINCGKGGYALEYIEANKLYIRIIAEDENVISRISVNSLPLALLGDTREKEITLDTSVAQRVEISFCDNSGLWINPFEDVKSNGWYYNAVEYCYTEGIMTGTSERTFAPNKTLTRGEFVTILGRIYEKKGGTIACNGTLPFKDISDSAYYYTYLCWAYNNKIVSGISNTKFAPSATLTREQMCMMLYNYSEFGEKTEGFNETLIYGFDDYDKISSWGLKAVSWAVDQRIISGNKGKLSPKDTATRAQAATVIMNYFDK